MLKAEDTLELRGLIHQFIRLFGVLDQSVTPCGYNLNISQVMALQEIEKELLSVTKLADKLRLDRSTVSRLIDNLVKNDFVERQENENNRRETLLFLTERGKRSLKEVKNKSLVFFNDVLGNLSESQQQQLLQSFREFTSALSKYRGE